jgi:PPE-repeat protein
MKTKSLGLLAAVSLTGLSTAHATTYTYDVDYLVNTQQGFYSEVTGTIVTTADSGTLTSDEILSYTFSFGIAGSPPSPTVTISGGSPSIYGDNLTATPTTISFTPAGMSTDFRTLSGCVFFDDLACEDLNNSGQFGFLIGPTLGDNSDTGITSTSIVIATAPSATPLPAALPLFTAGLGALGLLGWRRKRTARSVAV